MSHMATLIPPEGETIECPGPADENAIRVTLGVEGVEKAIAADGSTWWYANPTPIGAMGNEKATRFLHARNGGVTQASWTQFTTVLYGKVLYLSADETRKINHTREEMVPIPGKTYDVREKLKALGARWDPQNKKWLIAKSRLDLAIEIVRKGP